MGLARLDRVVRAGRGRSRAAGAGMLAVAVQAAFGEQDRRVQIHLREQSAILEQRAKGVDEPAEREQDVAPEQDAAGGWRVSLVAEHEPQQRWRINDPLPRNPDLTQRVLGMRVAAPALP